MDMKTQRSSQLESRWIIVEEDIDPSNDLLSQTEVDLDDQQCRSNTHVCAHFDDHDMAVCSLNSLMEVEKAEGDNVQFQVKTEEGFISVEETNEKVCFIATLH